MLILSMATPNNANFVFENLFGYDEPPPPTIINKIWNTAEFVANEAKMTIYEICFTHTMLTINTIILISIVYVIIYFLKGRHRTRNCNVNI